MIAQLRFVDTSGIDVETYVAPDPENAGEWITLYIGAAGEQGEESFQILVCTPLWLQDLIEREGPQIGRHHLIVYPFNLQKAIEFLRARIQTVDGPNWSVVGERLSRLAHWEFEDYQEHRPAPEPELFLKDDGTYTRHDPGTIR